MSLTRGCLLLNLMIACIELLESDIIVTLLCWVCEAIVIASFIASSSAVNIEAYDEIFLSTDWEGEETAYPTFSPSFDPSVYIKRDPWCVATC